jgi:YVTN family beta-propeller protein
MQFRTTPAVALALPLLLAAATSANALTVFVSNEKENTVTVLDESLKIIKTIKTGLRPRGIRITPDFKEVLVCIGDDNRLDVIDTETLEISRTEFRPRSRAA